MTADDAERQVLAMLLRIQDEARFRDAFELYQRACAGEVRELLLRQRETLDAVERETQVQAMAAGVDPDEPGFVGDASLVAVRGRAEREALAIDEQLVSAWQQLAQRIDALAERDAA